MSPEGRVHKPRVVVVVAGLLCLTGSGLTSLRAQLPAAAAIYPVYEGYAENGDGSHTLVFGYYNSSPKPVAIPAGPENRFLPEPADRGQPTRFLPGRQRNVCRLIVPAGFEGNLQWSVSFRGAETRTTEPEKLSIGSPPTRASRRRWLTARIESASASATVPISRGASL